MKTGLHWYSIVRSPICKAWKINRLFFHFFKHCRIYNSLLFIYWQTVSVLIFHCTFSLITFPGTCLLHIFNFSSSSIDFAWFIDFEKLNGYQLDFKHQSYRLFQNCKGQWSRAKWKSSSINPSNFKSYASLSKLQSSNSSPPWWRKLYKELWLIFKV